MAIILLLIIVFIPSCATSGTKEPANSTAPYKSYNPEAIEHFEKGILCYNRLEYPDAKEYFKTALKIEPEYEEAKKKYYEVMWIIGKSEEAYGKRIDRIKRAKEELISDYNEGKQLFEKEDYKEAKIKFEQCLERIRWFPYPIDDGTYEELCRAAIVDCDKKLSEEK